MFEMIPLSMLTPTIIESECEDEDKDMNSIPENPAPKLAEDSDTDIQIGHHLITVSTRTKNAQLTPDKHFVRYNLDGTDEPMFFSNNKADIPIGLLGYYQKLI